MFLLGNDYGSSKYLHELLLALPKLKVQTTIVRIHVAVKWEITPNFFIINFYVGFFYCYGIF